MIYPIGTYTTEDERKLNESELRLIASHLKNVKVDYFNAVINRFIPEWKFAAMADRALLRTFPCRPAHCGAVYHSRYGREMISGKRDTEGS